MRRFLTIALTLTLGGMAVAADAPTTKIVLIGQGGLANRGQNEYMADLQILAKCLQQTPGVKAVVSEGWPEKQEDLKDAKALVLAVDNGGKVLLDPKRREQVDRMLKSGIGLTAIHKAIIADVGMVGERYREILGGWANRQFAAALVQAADVTVSDPKHPVCNGIKDFTLREDYHLKLKFAKEATPVLSTKIFGRDFPVAWVYERPDAGKGRSFGFVSGRFHESYKDETLRRVLTNGILWTARVAVPKDGAKVAVTQEDLKLPEPPKLEASGITAAIKTNKGTIHLNLFTEKTPLTCANFINLAQRRYYDGLTFHRVISNFMIQGGCPEGTGRGDPGYKFEDEIVPELVHDRPGILSMANAGPRTNGSQFFITHKDTPWLNGKHTVFGAVVGPQDQDVVDSIAKGDKIESITIQGDTTALMEKMKDRLADWNATIDRKFPNLPKAP
jgi:peptidyl-prolyl cis-trans isomerase B (cyclophilin B)